ncbi:MW1434 family type I TA system toxin [Comamonas testosteroni]|uniref:Thoeris anti-defense Tad2 family protein n=1 Tax=Comamonas testosteroni TaxID=285 RepID=UPI0026EDEBF9|nr:MW1434 family type I TA system toxin [Comamonas testosteroni]WQD45785.1 MW1434 family type I TA system toxin [Comamonas testosteroni]
MKFGDAIKELQLGKRLQRTGWNGKGLFVYLLPAASYPVQTGVANKHFGEGAMVP